MTAPKPGDVYRSDRQACVWGTRYRYIERVPGQRNTWVVEQLAPGQDIVDEVLAYYERCEREGRTDTYPCMPIWDKTWAQCAEGERPQRIGWTTVADELFAELARLEEGAGRRMTVRFVSAAEYAKHF